MTLSSFLHLCRSDELSDCFQFSFTYMLSVMLITCIILVVNLVLASFLTPNFLAFAVLYMSVNKLRHSSCRTMALAHPRTSSHSYSSFELEAADAGWTTLEGDLFTSATALKPGHVAVTCPKRRKNKQKLTRRKKARLPT